MWQIRWLVICLARDRRIIAIIQSTRNDMVEVSLADGTERSACQLILSFIHLCMHAIANAICFAFRYNNI